MGASATIISTASLLDLAPSTTTALLNNTDHDGINHILHHHSNCMGRKEKELQNTLLDRKDKTMNIGLETAEIFCDSQTLYSALNVRMLNLPILYLDLCLPCD